MRLQLKCQQCFHDGRKKDEGKTPPYIPTYPYWEYPIIELEKWPYIEHTCNKGHKQRFLLSLELYELLFEQATYCIMDGYYREAIGTYHAALERFFEYAIEMLCPENNIDVYNSFWKKISKRSEQQIGAFYALWTAHFKEIPEFLDDNKINIRNKVVHQGELASMPKAKEYGEYVFNYIKKSIDKLEKAFGNELQFKKVSRQFRICKEDLEAAWKDPLTIEIDGEIQTMSPSSVMLTCMLNNPKIKNYTDCFKKQNLNDMFGLIK